MKIRKGFVSNSSSSSFLVYIPDKMTVDDLHIEAKSSVYAYYGNADVGRIKELFAELRLDKDIVGYDNTDSYNALQLLLKDAGLQLASIPAASDDGHIIALNDADLDRITAIREKFK